MKVFTSICIADDDYTSGRWSSITKPGDNEIMVPLDELEGANLAEMERELIRQLRECVISYKSYAAGVDSVS